MTFSHLSFDLTINHILLNFRFHIMKVGKDIVPYKPIASRIRSKSLKQGIQELVKCQIESPVVDDEYMDFLNRLLTLEDITPSSNKALSTSILPDLQLSEW